MSKTTNLRHGFIFGILAVLMWGHVAAEVPINGRASPRPERPHAIAAFHLANATPLAVTAPKASIGGLDLAAVEAWNTEDITVYGKRHVTRPPKEDQRPIVVGPVALSGSSKTDQIGFSGMTVTGAIPISGVPGLDAVANLSGGHDSVTSSSTRESAALIVGFRLKF